jgi:hypothetical protein
MAAIIAEETGGMNLRKTPYGAIGFALTWKDTATTGEGAPRASMTQIRGYLIMVSDGEK